jgi:hypothetical protein
MMSGFHTGDLNPIWTVPMLGTHKALRPTAYSFVPFARSSLRSLRFRRRVSLVVGLG